MQREVKTSSSLILPTNSLYVGVDESNHGRFPEVFVAAFSGLDKYSQKGSFSKVRRSHTLFKPSSEIEYSFLLASESDYQRISQRELLGVVVASLVKDQIPIDLNHLEILVDGEHLQDKRIFLRDLVSEVCCIDKKIISLKVGADFDQKYPLVNLADDIAHYLFRKVSPEQLSQDVRQKTLIK